MPGHAFAFAQLVRARGRAAPYLLQELKREPGSLKQRRLLDAMVKLEKVYGSVAADTLSAAPAGTELYGGLGADRLVGGPGEDYLVGEGGILCLRVCHERGERNGDDEDSGDDAQTASWRHASAPTSTRFANSTGEFGCLRSRIQSRKFCMCVVLSSVTFQLSTSLRLLS